MPERWLQVERIYSAVVARPESEWATVLAELCTGDDSLRYEVESLLEHENAASTFLEMPAFAGADVAGQLAVERVLVGRRFGSYTVLSPIGSGGMGEVYRARDERLGRQVAIKLLPSHLASDADRRARLESEARVLAALNHPHIGAIYGLEDVDGCPALVLELVEGETLAEHVARGPLSLAQALPIARQIADALEAAHGRGIIHRDLKPANIKITSDGVVKVLDFGLAKFGAGVSGRSGESDAQSAATQACSAPVTRTGLIFGTLAYVSPEQAAGRAADTRSDLWAFGVVLWEMLTGRPAFTGETDADVLESVLHAEPDLTGLPAETPGPIRRLLRRCLEKDRTRRLDSAAVARFEIDDAIAAPAAETAPRARPSRRVIPLAIAAFASVALLAALAVWILMRPPLPAPVVSRFAIVTPPAWPLNTKSLDRDLALSPDGRYLVYRVGTANVGGELMVRAIDQLEERQLPGIERAFTPFFSPDSRWIGFFEYHAIKKVAISGGPVITLGPVTGEARGASWGVDNTIVFATDDPSTGLWRVSADGGEPTVLTRPDARRHETDHLFPSVLPNGRGVVFTIAAAGQASGSQLAVLDLETGQWKTVVSGGTQGEYVAPAPQRRQGFSIGSGRRGHLVYAAVGSLRAIEFDPARLDVLDDPVTVAEDVLLKPTGSANFAVSFLGTLVYVPRGAFEEGETRRSLVWVDRRGREQPLTNAPKDFYNDPDISPDGTRVAIKIGGDIWIGDFAPAMWRRLTFDPREDSGPHWTPDGRQIIFVSDRAGAVPNVYSQAADGTGTADRLTTTANGQYLTAVTPDGTAIIGFDLSPKGARSVIRVHLRNAANRPGRGVRTPVDGQVVEVLFEGGRWPDISRDGRYLTYESAESGRNEIYVRPFPHVDGGRWQVSTSGGTRALWARSGRELFYLDASNKLTAVPVQTSGPTFVHGSPTRVSETSYVAPSPSRHFDEAPDGRILVIKTAIDADPNAISASMVVVEHWLEELKGRGR